MLDSLDIGCYLERKLSKCKIFAQLSQKCSSRSRNHGGICPKVHVVGICIFSNAAAGTKHLLNSKVSVFVVIFPSEDEMCDVGGE